MQSVSAWAAIGMRFDTSSDGMKPAPSHTPAS